MIPHTPWGFVFVCREQGLDFRKAPETLRTAVHRFEQASASRAAGHVLTKEERVDAITWALASEWLTVEQLAGMLDEYSALSI